VLPGSGSTTVTIRLKLENVPGVFGRVASAIGSAGGNIGAIDIVRADRHHIVRDVTVQVPEGQVEEMLRSLRHLAGVEVVRASDRTFLVHLGGKIEIRPRVPVKTRDDLSLVYTPGVARVARAIAAHPEDAFRLTIKRNTVAVVTDGSAVLGLGDLGPLAALPVMEGKCLLFKQLAGVDAFPLCLDARDPAAIVATVRAVAPSFGGINLEDISSPRCFEIEERLQEDLDIPVFHDDQHGTAVVVLAGLLNALKLVGKRLEDIRVVISGVGAAGVATTKMLLQAGVKDIVGCDRQGALHRGREVESEIKRWYAEHTNPEGRRGSLREVLQGADVFIGLSGPHLLTAEDIKRMAPDPIVFALANPVPEIDPEEAARVARVVATGRSDYPNQINNCLCFPGFFKGALEVRARRVTEEMKLAAARAIAEVVGEDELSEEYIIPTVFNRKVVDAVARAVARAAVAAGVARKTG
jgi:malate dehydrogenase (oxaloacetate-decarboxylating)